MRVKRQLLSLVLSLGLVFSAVPYTVFAGDGAGEGPACTCETACSEGSMNLDCPVCGVEGALPENCGQYQAPEPTAVETVQALIDALPTAEALAAMTQEEQSAVYADLQAAYDAYEALTDEEKQEVTGAELFEALFAVFNGIVNSLGADAVTYIDENGDSQTCADYTVVSSSDTTWSSTDGQTKWYVVSSDVTIGSADNPSRVTVTGNVSLILTDNCTLTINGGIGVLGGNFLTIYGQTGGTGKLICQIVADNYAGIGGNAGTTVSGNVDGNFGQITIHGGTIEVTGGSNGAGIGCGPNGTGGTINITGGTVTAQGGTGGAGIGHGGGGTMALGTITISGGVVKATGASYGAGIGGKGCTISISGESTQITAQGGTSCAGIGGSSGDAGTITISGGTVDATGGSYAAGIGGGGNGSGGNITISGGTVTAKGGTGGAGIGGGQYTGTNTTITITGGTVTVAGGGSNAADIGGGGTSSSGTLASNSITIGESATVKTADGGDPYIGPVHGPDTGTWANDENNHWHPCMIANCNESSHQSGSAAHSYAASVNESGTLVSACTTCGYVNETTYSGYSLQSIRVDTQPNKLTYNGGESLDLTGLAIKATYSNGTDNVEVSLSYNSTGVTCSPAHGTTLNAADHNGKSIEISFGGKATTTSTLTVTAATESSGLVEGNTYWFDLSDVEIPGTVNSALSDKTLSWVPFTYVGAVDAYVLNSSSNGVADASEKAASATESSSDEEKTYGYKYSHNLFIADYNLNDIVSWDDLNTAGLIFGKDYSSGGVTYTLRAPTVGNSTDISSNAMPSNNECVKILEKGSGYDIKNLFGMWFWGQDTSKDDVQKRRVYGEHIDCGNMYDGFESSISAESLGYRPVLELPDDSDTTGLTTVTIDLDGGSLNGSTDTVELIVKSGESYTAPSNRELTPPEGKGFAGWKDNNNVSYMPGASVPSTVSRLTVVWLDLPAITKQPVGTTYYVGDTAIPLSVEASVTDNDTIFYQWMSSITGDYSDIALIEGAQSSTYTPPTTLAGTTYYYCFVYNIYGGGGVLTQSDPAVVTVLERTGSGGGSTPTYTRRTLTGEHGVSLTGSRVHQNAKLTVKAGDPHPQGSCAACDALWALKEHLVALYELSLSRDFRGSVQLTFTVPEAYEGQTLTVVHCGGGTLERWDVPVSNGKVEVTVDSLGLFAILDGVYDLSAAAPDSPGESGTPETPVSPESPTSPENPSAPGTESPGPGESGSPSPDESTWDRPSGESGSASKTDGAVPTGDQSGLGLWLTLGLASLAGILAGVRQRGKKAFQRR